MNDNIEIQENNNSNNNKSKGLLVLVILLVIALLGTIGYILYDKGVFSNKNNNEVKQEESNNKNEEKKKISDSTKKELLNIIGLTEEGYPRTTEESFSNRDVVDMSGYDLAGVFVNLSGEVIIKNKDYFYLQWLIKTYAHNNNMVIEYLITDEKELLKLNVVGGPSFRNGLSKENYKKIAKLYNLPENGDEIFKKTNENEIGIYKDYYVLYPDSFIGEFYNIKDNLSYDSNENEIIINYNVKLDEINDDYKDKKESELEHINKSIKYTFKQYDDGSYYLYSVKVTNN